MKYKVGDKVRVRSDLVVDKRYGCDDFILEMKYYLGAKATIVYKDNYTYYLDIDNKEFCWTDEMLEPIKTSLEDIKDMPLDKALEKLHKEDKTIVEVDKEIKYEKLDRLTLADLDTYNDLILREENNVVYSYAKYKSWALTTLKERIENGLYKCRIAKKPFVYDRYLHEFEFVNKTETQIYQLRLLDAMQQWSNYYDNGYEFFPSDIKTENHYISFNYDVARYVIRSFSDNECEIQYFSSEQKAKECLEWLQEMELI